MRPLQKGDFGLQFLNMLWQVRYLRQRSEAIPGGLAALIIGRRFLNVGLHVHGEMAVQLWNGCL